MRALPIVMLTVGCATAGKPDHVGNNPDGGHPHPDGTAIVYMDAPAQQPDAPPGQQSRTLSQTTSPTLVAGASLACGSSAGTSANNYYRVFDLPSLGITTDFHVSQISFQIEDSETNIVVAVRAGTYSGTPGATLSTASMTVLASNATVNVPNVVETFNNGVPSTPGGTANAPITATIPAGQKLLVEVDVPDGSTTSKYFYMGANAAGESGTSYISSSACNPPGTTPTSVSQVGGKPIDLLLTVTGTY